MFLKTILKWLKIVVSIPFPKRRNRAKNAGVMKSYQSTFSTSSGTHRSLDSDNWQLWMGSVAILEIKHINRIRFSQYLINLIINY